MGPAKLTCGTAPEPRAGAEERDVPVGKVPARVPQTLCSTLRTPCAGMGEERGELEPAHGTFANLFTADSARQTVVRLRTSFSFPNPITFEADMSDSSKKALSPELLLHIATSLNVSLPALVATIALLDEGGTVPFLARYRKEATGALDEVQIRDIEDKLGYFRDPRLAPRNHPRFNRRAGQADRRAEAQNRKPASTRANSKTSTSPTSPGAAPRPPSPATKASNPSPIISGTRRATAQPACSSHWQPPSSSSEKGKSRQWSRTPSKALAISSPKRIA